MRMRGWDVGAVAAPFWASVFLSVKWNSGPTPQGSTGRVFCSPVVIGALKCAGQPEREGGEFPP